jgi:hypothetical protein
MCNKSPISPFTNALLHQSQYLFFLRRRSALSSSSFSALRLSMSRTEFDCMVLELDPMLLLLPTLLAVVPDGAAPVVEVEDDG